MWQQRARFKWLKERDANTVFFHQIASAKKRASTIDSLETVEGVIREARRLQRHVSQYFKDIFTNQHQHCISLRKGDWESILEPGMLKIEFSDEEIKEVV